MGVWGMGLTQSDEFCEVYEQFMDRYNRGDEVSTIISDILAEYHNEFSDDDGILHDVYFALAKAEWMCCAQSETVINKVKTIIESEANISFYRELEATEADLKKRRKNLEKFWETLQTPRVKPRQRRIDPLDRVKELPPIQPGDCYAYKFDTGYRIVVILDRFQEEGRREHACCCILNRTFSSIDIDVIKEEIGYIAEYIGNEFIAKSKLRKLTPISVPENFKNIFLKNTLIGMGRKKLSPRKNSLH